VWEARAVTQLYILVIFCCISPLLVQSQNVLNISNQVIKKQSVIGHIMWLCLAGSEQAE
jgi:hypothetical protein